MADLTLEQAQKLIQEYKSIIRLLETKTSEFKDILEKENENIGKTEELKEDIFKALQAIVTIYENLQELDEKVNKNKSNFEEEVTNLISSSTKEIEKKLKTILSNTDWEVMKIKSKVSEIINTADNAPNTIKNALKEVEETTKTTINDVTDTIKEYTTDYKRFIDNQTQIIKEKTEEFKNEVEELSNQIDLKLLANKISTYIIIFVIGFVIGGLVLNNWAFKALLKGQAEFTKQGIVVELKGKNYICLDDNCNEILIPYRWKK